MATANPSKLPDNLKKADEYLARFRGKRLPHFIDGRHDDGRSGTAFDNLTPIDNSRICEVARGGAADIDAAAQAAKRAFPAWRDLRGEDRKRLLHRVADLRPHDAFQRHLLRGDDVDLQIARAQRRGGLEADEAGADHHHAFVASGFVDDRLAVGQRAQVVHAR